MSERTIRRVDASNALAGAVPRVMGVQSAILAWHDRHRRAFAFRGPRDPYAVLVSEVILQQTQASRGEAAWQAFMLRFPTIAALAAAAPADVLRAWAGLGYNRRALNLRLTAIAVQDRHGGALPRSIAELEALPGVGPYTARAVAAIAFGAPVGAVDTNVRRILGRVAVGHGSARDPGEALPARDLQALADTVVPPDHAADWTAALMDIGAMLCTPRAPACGRCPLAAACAFAGQGWACASVPAARDGPAARQRGSDGRTAREPAPRYETTSRWLRGRLLARLCELPDGAFAEVPGSLGDHDAVAVRAAVASLTRDGLVEADEGGRIRLPLR